MKRRDLLWWSLIAFVFFIPIYQIIATVLAIVSVLLAVTIGERRTPGYTLMQGWDCWIFVLILAGGMLYTDHVDIGLRNLETSLSLIALPVVFASMTSFDQNKLRKLFYSFGFGLLLASLYCLTRAAVNYATAGDVDSFFGDRLTAVLDNTHPIYFAYYLILMITFGLYLIYYEEKTFVSAGLTWILTIFFFLMLLLMDSGTAIVGVVFPMLYFALKFVYEDHRTKFHYVAFLTSILLLICLFAISNLDFRGNIASDDYWERYVLWESAMNALPNWLIGVGTGDSSSILNEYYRTHDLSVFATSNYNAHNQFVETLFEVGVPGLLALIIMIGRPIYLSVQNQNILGFLCIFPFLVYGMTEVFLGRYQGVVFFAVLHQAFVSLSRQQQSFSLKVDRI